MLCWYVNVDSNKSGKEVLGSQPVTSSRVGLNTSSYSEQKKSGPKLLGHVIPLTKLSFDSGHIRDSFIAIIITFSVKLLGTDVHSGNFRFWFTAYFAVNLQMNSKMSTFTTVKAYRWPGKWDRMCNPSPRSLGWQVPAHLLHFQGCPR